MPRRAISNQAWPGLLACLPAPSTKMTPPAFAYSPTFVPCLAPPTNPTLSPLSNCYHVWILPHPRIQSSRGTSPGYNIATYHQPDFRATISTCCELQILQGWPLTNTSSVLNVFSQLTRIYKHVNLCMSHVKYWWTVWESPCIYNIYTFKLNLIIVQLCSLGALPPAKYSIQ